MDDSEEPPAPIVQGKAELLLTGSDVYIWSCGREVYQALYTAQILREQYGISAGVVNVRSLKPFDRALLVEQAKQMPVVTMEDHVKSGGLASVAAEVLAEETHHGIQSFGWEADKIVPHGEIRLLRRDAGLLPENIAEKIFSRFFRQPGNNA